MASSAPPDEVYARQLWPQKRGHPLIIPEPSTTLPPQFIDRGVGIGDVGIIKNGSFLFVFSALAPVDDPVNYLGVPHNFQPFRPNERLFFEWPNMHQKGSELTSSSITKHNIAVDGGLTENPCAAVLNMPDGARSIEYGGLKDLRSYAIRNAKSWYNFINGELGLEAPNGSLYLVSGCDKSRTWGIASVSQGSSSNMIALRFTAAKTVQASVSYTFSWQTDCSTFARAGPDLSDDNPLPQNQCLFVRGLKIRVRDNAVMRQMRGAVKVESTEDMESSSLSSAKRSNSFPGTSSSRQPSPTSTSSSCSSAGYQDFADTPDTSDDEWSSDEEELDDKHQVRLLPSSITVAKV
ncbi:hypothetical protein FIBSPDRAFT_745741 [Athelia psychrophila]|uniref:Uncharacterized protein n=1 Tax=Athelia psychrophila TaxID=1759441 RepID=A0A166GV28_9AGAM|nr:hypothetical protein FIBSPDRAFT_745741 [Fibularhizoctonia sp. CBS 109695]